MPVAKEAAATGTILVYSVMSIPRAYNRDCRILQASTVTNMTIALLYAECSSLLGSARTCRAITICITQDTSLEHNECDEEENFPELKEVTLLCLRSTFMRCLVSVVEFC